MNKKIKFADCEDKIRDSLKKNKIKGEKSLLLIGGFMPQFVKEKTTDKEILEAQMFPMIGVVGQTSGQIYTFSLKALLPDE